MLPLILSSTPRSRPFHVKTPYASPLRPLGRVRTRVNLQNVSPYRSGSVVHALFATVLPTPPFGSVDANSYKFGRNRIFGKSSIVCTVPGAFTAAAARFTASRIPLRTFGPWTTDADADMMTTMTRFSSSVVYVAHTYERRAIETTLVHTRRPRTGTTTRPPASLARRSSTTGARTRAWCAVETALWKNHQVTHP